MEEKVEILGATSVDSPRDDFHHGPVDALAKPDIAGPEAVQPNPSTAETITVAGQQEYLTGFALNSAMVSLTLVGFLMLLDTSIVSTVSGVMMQDIFPNWYLYLVGVRRLIKLKAVPRITTTFHSLNDVGWYGTADLLSNCALQPLTGKMYTYFNNKWTFLSFFTIFELGSILCGAAKSSNMLIIGRAFAGMGASGLLNGAYTIIHASIPREKQACFYINLPCAPIVGPLLIFTRLPDHDGKDSEKQTLVTSIKRLDLFGFALFAGAAIQALLALNWGGTSYAWNSATVIGLFCGAGATLLAFIVSEYYMGAGAMMPFSIITRRVIWASCINYSFFAGCLVNSTYYLPMYFQAVRNATPTMSGVDLLPSILGNIFCAIITAILVSRVGYYLPFAAISGALTMIGTGLLITLTPNTSVGRWVGFQILQGVGRGFGLQSPLLAVQHSTPKQEISIVTALLVFSQNFGGAIFLSLAEVIFSTGLRSELKIHSPQTDPESIIEAGAVAVQSVVSAADLPGVLLAYNEAIVHIMYLGTSCAGGALLFAFGMGWVSIKAQKTSGTEEKGGEVTPSENMDEQH